MDNELLIQLIQTHNRLVIPSLGAFLKKDQAGVGVVVYTPFLKIDDGILAAAISENYGTTAEESQIIISEFVCQVNAMLEQNGSYDITGIGTLKRDINGSIVLLKEHKARVEEAQSIVTQSVVIPQPVQQPVVVPQPISQPVQQPVVVPQPVQQPVVVPQPVQQPIVVPQPISQPVTSPQPSVARQPIQQRVQPSVVRPQAPQPRFPTQSSPSPQQQQGRPMSSPTSRPATAPQGNPQQRPVNPNQQRKPVKYPKSAQPKLDIWLIIAIIAAILVTALLIYGYMNTDPTIDLTPIMDETVVTDTLSTVVEP